MFHKKIIKIYLTYFLWTFLIFRLRIKSLIEKSAINLNLRHRFRLFYGTIHEKKVEWSIMVCVVNANPRICVERREKINYIHSFTDILTHIFTHLTEFLSNFDFRMFKIFVNCYIIASKIVSLIPYAYPSVMNEKERAFLY